MMVMDRAVRAAASEMPRFGRACANDRGEDAAKLELVKKGAEETDAELMRRVGSGHRPALAELYDRHATPAYSLARRLVGPTAAEDVVQDAFVALATRADSFDPARGTFRAWFLTSVHRRCLNRLRDTRPTDDE